MNVIRCKNDKKQVVQKIFSGKQQELLDVFVQQATEKFWSDRSNHRYPRLEKEDDVRHVYILGIVTGMVMYVDMISELVDEKGECEND